mgnify:CR=1 FL=1
MGVSFKLFLVKNHSYKKQYPLFLGNQPVMTERKLGVTDKYTDEVFTETSIASPETILEGIRLGVESRGALAKMATFERAAILEFCVKRIQERSDELAYLLCLEAGKPIKDARTEVTRLIDTFKLASQEATRLTGEVLPLDISARAKGYFGMWKRVPIGLCSFISPFNFPLNLSAHKIAPAIAVGCPFILKPASRTPVSTLLLGEILAETALPKGSFSILPCERDGADYFTTDERVQFLSFTGSPEVGWALKAKAGKKKVTLELGGNAACLIDEEADLQDASQRIIAGAFAQSGQSCISVQRIYVHDKNYEAFKSILIEKTQSLKSGDPKDETFSIGPMISLDEAKRIESWVQKAVAKGAKILTGGTRIKNIYEATLLENVPEDCEVSCKEAFGPVAILNRYTDYEKALEAMNRSSYGLQAGLFIKDIYKIQKAWDRLEVGGVVIGDVPSFRVDNMPYGGVKDSGLGREGVKFAMEEMTEMRLLMIRTP